MAELYAEPQFVPVVPVRLETTGEGLSVAPVDSFLGLSDENCGTDRQLRLRSFGVGREEAKSDVDELTTPSATPLSADVPGISASLWNRLDSPPV